MLIRDLKISARAKACLLSAGYTTLEEVANLSDEEMLAIHNLNKSAVDEIKNAVMQDIEVGARKAEVSLEEVYAIPIRQLDLSARAMRCLRRAKIDTVRELCIRTSEDLMEVRNLGRKQIEELLGQMKQLGVSFRGEETEPFLYLYPEYFHEILKEKNDVWEYKFFVEAFIVNYRWMEAFRNYQVELFKGGPEVITAGELSTFLHTKIDQITSTVKDFAEAFNVQLKRAFGEPGEPGDEYAIIDAVNEIIDTYKRMIKWGQDFDLVMPSDDVKEIIEEMSLVSEEVRKSVDALYEKCIIAKNQMDDYIDGKIEIEDLHIDLNIACNCNFDSVLSAMKRFSLSLRAEDSEEESEYHALSVVEEDDEKGEFELTSDNCDIKAFYALAKAIFGEEISYPEDFKEAMVEVLESLTDRERNVLIKRFGLNGCGAHTLEATGAYFGVTRERIRQIEAKSLRKLRHPSRSKKLRKGLAVLEEERVNITVDENSSIDDLVLSVRSYNCLKRAGINTVGELSQYSCRDLKKVRNLGRRSLGEVIEVLFQHGIQIKDTYFDDKGLEIEWLRGYPMDIANFALYKGSCWEHLLLAKAIIFEMQEMQHLYEKQKNISLSDCDEDVAETSVTTLPEFITYTKSKLEDIKETTPKDIGYRLKEAIGKDGEPGNSELIIKVAKELTGVYRDIFLWRRSFELDYFSQKFYKVIQAVIEISDNIGDDYIAYIQKMHSNVSNIERVINGLCTAEDIELDYIPDFNFDFDILNSTWEEFLSEF